MKFNEFPVEYYVKKLQENQYHSLVCIGDAEWYCAMNRGTSEKIETGLGQILDANTGVRIIDVMQRRQSDPSFIFSTPSCLWTRQECVRARIGERIERLLLDREIDIEFYERDMVNDDLAEAAGLYPFIQQFQKMNIIVIGNSHLSGLDFLGYNHFIEISSPNLHLEEDGIENAVENALSYGQSGAYLVSAGVSASLIIDQLHGRIEKSWFLDCGSIWDAFVGIGAQREWRKILYKNQHKYRKWLNANLHGIQS